MSYLKHIAATYPLPSSFPDTEIALMTAAEFLDFKNPQDKFHPSDSYDYSLKQLNKNWNREYIGKFGYGRKGEYSLNRLGKGYYITPHRSYSPEESLDLAGVIIGGVLYYDLRNSNLYSDLKESKRLQYWDTRRVDIDPSGGVIPLRGFKAVKYLKDYYNSLDPVKDRNIKQYPYILKQFTVRGELFTLRSEEKPTSSNKDEQFSIAILNSEGFRVGVAQDEWGATLISVAQEYRGYGLGELLGEYWYKLNPNSNSGGFTASGEKNALRVWAKRVSEFLNLGWYSELIKSGRLDKIKYNTIMADYRRFGRYKYRNPLKGMASESSKLNKREVLIYTDLSSSIIVYDSRFLDDQDEKYILGHVHMGDSPEVGYYVYSIDYESQFRELTTMAALQLAKELDEPLYNGEGYHDLLDLTGISGFKRKRNYIHVEKDYMDLRGLARKEKRMRTRVDPYNGKTYLLQEMAEAKW